MLPSRTVAIAGAGIGGLTASLALAARGFKVIVFERAERLEEVGAGLQLSPNASRVLIELGLQPKLAPRVTRPAAVRIMTARSGGEVVRLPLANASDNAPYWLLHRADLQAALLAGVSSRPNITLRLGEPVESFSERSSAVTVNGETVWALIGADGARSAVRSQIFPQAGLQFSGLIAWRGSIDVTTANLEQQLLEVQLWMGPHAHLVAYPISSGQRINMVAVVPGSSATADGDDAGSSSEIQRHFAASRWPASARAMIDAVDNWRRWPLFTMPDGGVWQRGRVALLGDAAHAMLPFAAQGAGMAIEDAAVLATCMSSVTNDSGLPAALVRYAGLRGPRVGRVQRTARQSGRIYHLQGPMALARDIAMRLLGAQRLQARQDWIYDWTA